MGNLQPSGPPASSTLGVSQMVLTDVFTKWAIQCRICFIRWRYLWIILENETQHFRRHKNISDAIALDTYQNDSHAQQSFFMSSEPLIMCAGSNCISTGWRWCNRKRHTFYKILTTKVVMFTMKDPGISQNINSWCKPLNKTTEWNYLKWNTLPF